MWEKELVEFLLDVKRLTPRHLLALLAALEMTISPKLLGLIAVARVSPLTKSTSDDKGNGSSDRVNDDEFTHKVVLEQGTREIRLSDVVDIIRPVSANALRLAMRQRGGYFNAEEKDEFETQRRRKSVRRSFIIQNLSWSAKK